MTESMSHELGRGPDCRRAERDAMLASLGAVTLTALLAAFLVYWLSL